MARITIRTATFRDISFVAAHMRDQDAREIYCQLPEGTTSIELAYFVLESSALAYTAYYSNSPIMAFGFSPASAAGTVYTAWAFGTKQIAKAVPTVSRYGMRVCARELIFRGVRRVEVRSIEDHDIAHKWLSGLNAVRECDLIDYGRNGETFQLWSWTRTNWDYVSKYTEGENSPKTTSAID